MKTAFSLSLMSSVFAPPVTEMIHDGGGNCQRSRMCWMICFISLVRAGKSASSASSSSSVFGATIVAGAMQRIHLLGPRMVLENSMRP